LLKRPINKYLTLLTKAAIYDANNSATDDIWRFWLQADVKF